MLDNAFLDDIGSDIVQSLLDHFRNWPYYLRHLNHVIGILNAPFREYDYVHLCSREEFRRILAEHHCRHIFECLMLSRAGQQVHLIKYFHKWLVFKVICQTTVHCPFARRLSTV